MSAKLMTADELLRLPRGRERHALVRGELRTLPLNDAEHGAVTATFSAELGTYVRQRGLGRTTLGSGYILTVDPDTVHGADVAFICAERGRLTEGYFPGAPDLVVEVVSVFDRYMDVHDALGDWLDYGARLVFLVNPQQQTVQVHRPGQPVRILTIEDTLEGEDIVPGWSLPVRELFDEP